MSSMYKAGDKVRLNEEGKIVYSRGNSGNANCHNSDYGIVKDENEITFYIENQSIYHCGYDDSWVEPYHNIENIIINLEKLEKKIKNK